jgi:autotransporter translocation and assembly factor TamB
VDLSLSLALLDQPLVVEAEARAEGGRLKADARLGESLTVAADLQAPDLAVFWPGLEGALSGTMMSRGMSTRREYVRICAHAMSGTRAAR